MSVIDMRSALGFGILAAVSSASGQSPPPQATRTASRMRSSKEYDLLPRLASLKIPTLVVYSGHDFIPPDAAVHIARAVSNARLIGLEECGHFSYMDCPAVVRTEIERLFRR